MHKIDAVADVRSAPYSGYNPQYNKASLEKALKNQGIAYVFLGKELGARREESECYRDGNIDYELVQKLPLFESGIERLLQGVSKMRVAMMCAEKDPLHCHRYGLIASYLGNTVIDIQHILADGSLKSQQEFESESSDSPLTGDLFE